MNCLKVKKSAFDFSSPVGLFFGFAWATYTGSNSSFTIPDPNLTFSNIQNTSITVSWKSANAPSTAPASYKAFYSLIPDLDSVTNIESIGSSTQNYTADTYQITFSNLIPNKYYYFNVIAQSSNSKLNYTKKCIQLYQNSTITDCSFDPLTISGSISTVAGTCGTSGSTDGSFTSALFADPIYSISQGTNIYISEAHNNTAPCLIRKLDLSASQVTTLTGSAGSGTCNTDLDGTLSAAKFREPHGLSYDGTNLYAVDLLGQTVRKISSTNVSTLAGQNSASGSTDGNGSSASFSSPLGLFFDGSFLYVGDSGNCKIRKVNPSTGDVSTFAGKGCPPTFSDSDGIGTAAMLNGGAGSIDTDGKYFYIAEVSNHRIRKLDISTGNITTLAGPSSCGTSACSAGNADGTGSAASFNSPFNLVYINKYLFVIDYASGNLRRVDVSTGQVKTITNITGTVNDAFGISFFNKKLYITLRIQRCIKSVQ